MAIDKLICVGKNYLEHARELGDAIPEKPVLFLKPASVLKAAKNWGDTVEARWPAHQDDLHYECEIVLRVAPDAKTFDAVSIGLDMTLRSVQSKLKQQGHPWTTGKVFVDAAIIGPWIALNDFPDFMTTPFLFNLDGALRQKGLLTDMTYSVDALMAYIQTFFPLCSGDLIYTGTPAGVGPVHPGAQAKLVWGGYQYTVKWLDF